MHFFQNIVKCAKLEIELSIDENDEFIVLESVQLFKLTYVTVWYPRSSPSLNFRYLIAIWYPVAVFFTFS